MMAAPPPLDAIAESPLKGCSLLGSPVFDDCEENKFELFQARIDAADTAYELAVAESKYEGRREARRRAFEELEARREARPQRLEDAVASVAHLIGAVPDAVEYFFNGEPMAGKAEKLMGDFYAEAHTLSFIGPYAPPVPCFRHHGLPLVAQSVIA